MSQVLSAILLIIVIGLLIIHFFDIKNSQHPNG
ncbi:MAG: hypothetical protein JWQ63_649 [Mucilaginibacter sp.]|nr:hypothetical protein [Mucilaginibacter sp.]